jgi:hypothetical protein
MPKLVPSRSPLGVYYRSPLGVRGTGGKEIPQYMEFQITAPLQTAFYISLQESRITYPDGTIAAWNETLRHKAGNDGWYFCERGKWDKYITPPAFIIEGYYGPITLVPGGNTYSPENPCPMTGVRFNRGLYKVKELDAQRTSISYLDVRPLKNLKTLHAGGGMIYGWNRLAYLDEVDFENAFLTELELGNHLLESMELNFVSISALEKEGIPNLKSLHILHSGALEILDFSGMLKLEEASVNSSTIQEALFFECPLLRMLSIFNCPLLSSLDFHGNPSLEYLGVYGVERGIIGIPSDSEIDRIGANIKKLDCSDLKSLKTLFVDCCPLLEEIDLTNGLSLDSISIKNCDSLSTLTLSSLPLLIGNPPSIYPLIISDCASLVSLDISGCKNLIGLKVNRTSLSFIDLSDMDKDKGMNVDLRQNALEDIRFGVLSETQIFHLNAAWNNFSQSKVVGILRMVYDHIILHPWLTGGSLILTYTQHTQDFPSDFWTKWDELDDDYGWTINISQAPFPW